VRQLLRPVDRIGFYGAGVVELLLPEATPEEALELGRSVVARGEGEPALACGIASFPQAASTAGTVLAAARQAARSAREGEPVRAATSAPTTVLLGAPPADGDIVLESPAMRELAATARRVARSTISLLLRGETGTGKEVLTRLIHNHGPRRDKPLVCVNCAAIPSQLVESTLFGHRKGAFTGAIADQKGVFEEADGGTLLLDEIGELPAAAQAALLRALETKRITRIGTTREILVDVRVIAATHRDLDAMSKTGAFRSDLLFRLNAFEVPIPPLRERREDIALLAVRFLGREAQAAGREAMSIDPEALALLEHHTWPGNVRELRNTIERAVLVADGDAILPRDLPERLRAAASRLEAPPDLASDRVSEPTPSVSAPSMPVSAAAPSMPDSASAAPDAAARPSGPGLYTGGLEERKKAFERDVLVAALRETAGHQTAAARMLDLPLRTFQFKMKAHGLRKHYSTGEDD
jgi:transcriptional regulator with GAF, ATPase, and Fis domain